MVPITVNIKRFVSGPRTELDKLTTDQDAIEELQNAVKDIQNQVGANPVNLNFIQAVVFVNGVNRLMNVGYDGTEPTAIP